MKSKRLLVIGVIALFAASAFGQTPAKSGDAAKNDNKISVAEDYEALVARLKKGDTEVDFKKLRLAYTESKNYAPYGGSTERSAILDALENKEYESALALCEAYLDKNYVDLFTLLRAAFAARESKNAEKSRFYATVFLGVVTAMTDDTDGKTAENAIMAVGINEQYILMSYLGYTSKGQQLVRRDGHTYDMHPASNEAGESREFWFNIDKVFGKF